MTYTTVPDKTVGDVFTEAMWDTYIRDNLNLGVTHPIAQSILGSTTASVTFSSIAQTHQTLELIVSARCDAAVSITNLQIRFNGDTGANYWTQSNYGQAGTPTAGEGLAATSGSIGEVIGQSSTSGHWSRNQVIVPDYRHGTFAERMWVGNTYSKWLATTGGQRAGGYSGSWANAAAVTTILLFPLTGSFVAGTILTLYAVSTL